MALVTTSPLGAPVALQDIVVSRKDMLALAVAEQAMRRMNLRLNCPRCTRIFGADRDGVIFENGPNDPVWVAACGCTRRICRNGQ